VLKGRVNKKDLPRTQESDTRHKIECAVDTTRNGPHRAIEFGTSFEEHDCIYVLLLELLSLSKQVLVGAILLVPLQLVFWLPPDLSNHAIYVHVF